ncbi:DUF7144 family membrane protein [Prauserella cavernicola]|uniref:DUF7144 domain-containing protein n=1 Tax=Prauserella cavernicola TaxID=2800127 RepID=A0A934QUX5_9PSEU|nr:hypothetical protein [Prauserella cavernicola]MBK1787026.1 hypothetical protein [Prauserella cavernicola]
MRLHSRSGASTATEVPPTRKAPEETGSRSVWTNWIAFAAVLMVVTGAFNVISGLVALLNDDYYRLGSQGLLVFNLTAWGWINLILGGLVLLTGLALFSGAEWAGISAVFLLALNALAMLAFLPAQPVWGVIIIVLDVVIIYALVAHGDDARERQWW